MKKASLILIFLLILSFLPLSIKAQDDWHLSSHSYRIALTVDSSVIDENLTDFPVLVYLNSSYIDWLYVNDNLSDLYFKDSDNDTLPYEIETYTVNDEAWIWVALDVTSGSDTVFYLYYGDVDAVSVEDGEAVWDSNFALVDHMQDYGDSSHTVDSTSNSNDGTKKDAGEPTQVTEMVSYAQSFDGSDDYIVIEKNLMSAPPCTVAAWVNPHSIVNSGRVISGHYGRSFLRMDSSKFSAYYYDGSGYVGLQSDVISADEWYFVVLKFNANGMDLYVDNVHYTVTSTANEFYDNPRFAIGISDYDLAGGPFSGIIDELKVSNIARSAAWIKASYYSESNALVSFSSVETYLAPTPTPEPYTSAEILSIAIVFAIVFSVAVAGALILTHKKQ